MVDLLDRITAMLEKENGAYTTFDYLSPEFQKQLASKDHQAQYALLVSAESSTRSAASSSSSSSAGINEVWREKICEWSYQVIDHFDFSREVVSVSIHYLDRYLATRTVNKKVFQLAAMTCLFLAIKLYEPGRLSMSSMIELSRGYFVVDQMATMEMSILRALSWHVHPPSAYCFAKHTFFLLPSTSVSMEIRHELLELARFLTELSVIDYYFVVHKPSTVGIAALVHAMREIPAANHVVGDFAMEVYRATSIDASSPEVQDCVNRLSLLYAQGGYARAVANQSDTRTETIPPVCVASFGFQQMPSRPAPYRSPKD